MRSKEMERKRGGRWRGREGDRQIERQVERDQRYAQLLRLTARGRHSTHRHGHASGAININNNAGDCV